MALQTAAATVSNYWRLVQANALSRIRRKAWFARLNKLEQRYVHFLLGSLSEDFFTMLDGKCPSVVTDTEKEFVASRKGLCKGTQASGLTAHATKLSLSEIKCGWI